MEDLDWYISQAGDDIHLIEKFEAEDSYDLYEALELDELAAPGAPPVVKGNKKLDVGIFILFFSPTLFAQDFTALLYCSNVSYCP